MDSCNEYRSHCASVCRVIELMVVGVSLVNVTIVGSVQRETETQREKRVRERERVSD